MSLNRGLRVVLLAVFGAVAIYLALAVGLVFSQQVEPLEAGNTLSFESVREADKNEDPGLTSYTARDGTQLDVRHYSGASPEVPLVVVIHGSGWHGGAYTPIGADLSKTLGFEVLIPDLRGHGPDPVRRGDLDYIGQFEDDLADLITTYNTTDRPVYMLGHSSGGGLTIRFAGGAYGGLIEKAVLLAPFLKHDAPTMRVDVGGWSHVLIRRVIGQSMLNAVGITVFNGLHMIQFNHSSAVINSAQGHTATQSYSYRLNTSFAPRSDYLADLKQLPEFLLIAGVEDEAFHAKAFETTLSAANPKGQYRLIEGVDHLGVISDARALTEIENFLK
ncbi:alpha/beta fold hydrolase [Pseudovibrio sp. Tun.PSC04-5.I4]|uniref:alpha/beta hydrolase n=1 Tax=Pseudovibrio sp. Tun.PSC04-5.I4 TaxID=1798213 RepID=UPI0008803A6B|nr:alpha/beta fold hydrolase [Pseudovibrio sp. Tun.PSC04-5.I4]SDQ73463.1 Serine aminopeptidase, S33 [Pseudovibrio sp. Tun.PSC04-5.I4]